jgi:hypothetical protein
MTVTPGVYTFTVGIDIATDLILSGGPCDVFILQTTGNLVVASGAKVHPCNTLVTFL